MHVTCTTIPLLLDCLPARQTTALAAGVTHRAGQGALHELEHVGLAGGARRRPALGIRVDILQPRRVQAWHIDGQQQCIAVLEQRKEKAAVISAPSPPSAAQASSNSLSGRAGLPRACRLRQSTDIFCEPRARLISSSFSTAARLPRSHTNAGLLSAREGGGGWEAGSGLKR